MIEIKNSFKIVPRSSGSVMKKEAVASFKTLISLYQTRRRHITEDSNIQISERTLGFYIPFKVAT